MGCDGCARGILLAFNLLLFLISVACLAVGIWVLIDGTVFLQVLSNIPNSDVYGKLISDAAYIIIATGGVIFLISFLGCCGAWKKNKCLLVTYAIIVGILLLLQVAVVVVAYFFYDNVISTINTQLAGTLNNSYDSKFEATSDPAVFSYTPGSIFSKGVDAIQIEFACCGVNNYTDYPTDMFPPTCCNSSELSNGGLKTLLDSLWAETITTYTLNDATCYQNSTAIDMTPGCSDSIAEFVRQYGLIIMIIAGSTMAVQLLLVIIACCLFCAIRNDETKV
ncbi:tetraspanin-18-like isoform X1 [Watersipora subatra]|uniref:tetraspanin-18-like isoform X1 n=1 Tax=Watersipora subatra TaxID=2589382 RepID=UPI00355BBDD3